MRGNRRPNTIRRYDEGMLLQWPMAPRTRVNATSLTAIGYAPTWSEKTTTTNSTAPSARQIPAIRRGVSGRTRLPPRMNSAKRFGATAPRQTRARTPAIAARWRVVAVLAQRRSDEAGARAAQWHQPIRARAD